MPERLHKFAQVSGTGRKWSYCELSAPPFNGEAHRMKIAQNPFTAKFQHLRRSFMAERRDSLKKFRFLSPAGGESPDEDPDSDPFVYIELNRLAGLG